MVLKYIADKKRHLICVPYSIDNLHRMAKELNIKKCWFHKNHYDIPKLRVDEIEKQCKIISTKEIIEIIKSPEYAETILSDEIKLTGASPSDRFWKQEIEYNGFN